MYSSGVCLNLLLMSQLTIFQLCRDGTSWVEPVLSMDKCVLLRDKRGEADEAPTRNPSVSSPGISSYTQTEFCIEKSDLLNTNCYIHVSDILT